MKKILQLRVLGLIGLFVCSAVAITAQEVKEEQKKRHLKMVRIEDGEKTVIDTVVTGDWSGMEWFDELNLEEKLDSSLKGKMKRFDLEVIDDGKLQNVFVFSTDDHPPIHWRGDFEVETESIVEGDSIKKVVKIKHGDGPMEHELMIHHDPHFVHVPKPQYPPMPIKWMGPHPDDEMVIRLDDPTIISYKKKELSDGREKIEIIRKKPDSGVKEFEIEEEIEQNE